MMRDDFSYFDHSTDSRSNGFIGRKGPKIKREEEKE